MTDQNTLADQTIPADQPSAEDLEMARDWAQSVLSGRAVAVVPWEEAVARVLGSLLPPPPLPTLADMSVEERVACRWMQANLAGRGERYVIAMPYDEDDDTVLISVGGAIVYADPGRVTPRPGLPRLEWPGDQEVEPAPATLAEGSVWDDAEALTRACEESGRDQIVVLDRVGYAFIWDEPDSWWEGYASPRTAPFTILHTGLEADQ